MEHSAKSVAALRLSGCVNGPGRVPRDECQTAEGVRARARPALTDSLLCPLSCLLRSGFWQRDASGDVQNSRSAMTPRVTSNPLALTLTAAYAPAGLRAGRAPVKLARGCSACQ